MFGHPPLGEMNCCSASSKTDFFVKLLGSMWMKMYIAYTENAREQIWFIA